MDDPTPSTLFPNLVAGLEQFRDRVAGDEGSYRVALLAPGQASAVVQIATDILQLVHDMLVWLRDGIDGLADRLVSIDALLAVVETLGALIGEVATVLDPSALPLPIPGLAEIQGGVTGNLGEVGGFLANAPSTEILPGPETFAELGGVLRDLVGPVDAEHPNADALGDLLTQLQSLGAE